MPNAAVRATAYCLNHTPELGLHYGATPYVERHAKPDSEFLANLPRFVQPYEDAARYAPNLTFIGAMSVDELGVRPLPWHSNLCSAAKRYGKYGEIMPEDEFLGLLDACDVFDLIWLEAGFAASVKDRLAAHPLLTPDILKRLESGRELSAIEAEVADAAALPLYCGGKVVGCCRRAHESDESLNAHVILENLANKAGSVLALLHLLKNAGMSAAEVDFVVECSEEAAGDMSQRGGGNFAKAVAEIVGCVNASGCDVRAFCAGPVNALIIGASLVAAGTRRNVVVLAGGALPKLYMNSRDHVKKGLPALENCLASFAALLASDDGTAPVIRLDALGKHSVGAGASPQAVTSALVWEPLQQAGLNFADVDKYAAELQIPEITQPAGAGNVPEANFKMIAALAVLKGQLDKSAISDFVTKHGLPGFAHTQGHIPSGVPFLGHAADAIRAGAIKRAMIIGKGSLFLARLTNLADGASFFVEAASGQAAAPLSRDEVKQVLLEVLAELSESLQKGN
ncbi:MAG: glycine/sarcosine/betaine reductase complex component C subunit beta [Desulfobaccales bacterium]